MNSTSSPSLRSRPLPYLRRRRSEPAFTLVELLVVMGIIAILTAIAVPLLPSIMRSNTMNQSVSTLSGILEQARESAVAGNTYVWVAFTSPSTSAPARGIWVATFQSEDGTETGVSTNPGVMSSWSNSVTVPGGNLQLQSKMRNLPGVQIAASSSLPTTVMTNLPSFLTTSLQTNLQWSVAPVQFTEGYSSSTYFTQAIEFTPSGEAHTGSTNAYNYVQFGLIPTLGSSSNCAAYNIGKSTGRTTVYRP